MEFAVRIKMNEKLYLKDPEQSELGVKIIKHGLGLINKLGFEEFTFKKLATHINTTEASIYRYFENKHRLLIYLISWHWAYLEYKILYSLNNIKNAEHKLKKVIEILTLPTDDKKESEFINEKELFNLIMWEGSKTYLTRHVGSDNKDKLFKPYKDLCARIAIIINEYNPKYKYPHSLATTLIEISHSQCFFMNHLPSLTDFGITKDEKKMHLFIESLVFNSLKK